MGVDVIVDLEVVEEGDGGRVGRGVLGEAVDEQEGCIADQQRGGG
jgi:hypothetical protein